MEIPVCQYLALHSEVVPASLLALPPPPSSVHSSPLPSFICFPFLLRPTDVLHQHEQQPQPHSASRPRRSSSSLPRQGVPPLLSPDSHSHSGAYLTQMQLRQHSFVQWTKWEKGGEEEKGRKTGRELVGHACIDGIKFTPQRLQAFLKNIISFEMTSYKTAF